ncbi:hypothetical protein CGLAU_01560 [Corynebacterium glaucum]|uniref:Uncharacterized protein n=2 Tax=Corynebacterium glaucum TaxID=187491 RepID=A0A1Q2HTY9_9CORY|nr:hypothetical protein CGLAU_01560 [Corynebacterium glaucum]
MAVYPFRMDNETRQFGSQSDAPEPQRRQRPKQYIPEQQLQEPSYSEPHYDEPYYAPEPADFEPEKRDNVPAIIFGVLFAIAVAAATVLFFLWRGAAAEADKPPVTVTQTATEVVTTTETTTRRPSLFGRDETTQAPAPAPGEPTVTQPPQTPAPAPDLELPSDVRDALDELVGEAESLFPQQ